MRIWEVEDNKAIPSNLVREQDFILRVRRLHRHGDPYFILNVALALIEPAHGGRGPIEEAQGRLQAFAATSNAYYTEMSNGDVFLIWRGKDAPPDIENNVMSIVLPAGVAPEDIMAYLQTFRLPEDYVRLRERTNHYIDLSRDASMLTAENTPAQLLQTEAARGPLTAWSVDLISKLLQEIDLNRYIKRQTVYACKTGGKWQRLFEEWFVSFDELKRAHFPKMELTPSDHLFHELCQALDQRLLSNLSQNVEVFDKQDMSMNLSIPSVIGSTFASFAHLVPKVYHQNIICEINCGDLLQDFALTLSALSSIHHEGFRIALDGVTPDMLAYINFGAFDADYIKLNVSQERFSQLNELKTREALMSIPREKLIFYRCDHETAFVLGLRIGVTKYQGWYFDNAARAAVTED